MPRPRVGRQRQRVAADPHPAEESGAGRTASFDPSYGNLVLRRERGASAAARGKGKSGKSKGDESNKTGSQAPLAIQRPSAGGYTHVQLSSSHANSGSHHKTETENHEIPGSSPGVVYLL